MHIKKRTCICFSTFMILLGSTCSVYAKTDTNTVGGTLTTDSGSAISSDVVDIVATDDPKKSKALKVDKGD